MRRTINSTIHLVVGLPVAIITSSLLQAVAVYALLAGATVWGAASGRDALFTMARACSILQRSRFAAVLGVQITPAPASHTGASWRQVWYHLIIGFLLSILSATLIIALWSGGIVAILLPVFASPGSFLFGVDLNNRVVWTGLIVSGLLFLILAVWLGPVLARLDVRTAQVMLQLSRTEELAHRVEVLTESRAEVVDAADAERRRIERDLHDGAQQRLVSLAMNLGMAREQLSGMDGPAKEVIERAHDEAKQALTELRELVRGLHPAVLDHRGLDAALSGIAARSPVPARLIVDVPVRPSPTVEAVAYFVVSEALTNVAKHASAAAVDITVRRTGSVLHLTIRDDGKGGADPARGSGLRGLAQRVSSVDGVLRVASPAGGPTVISVELPCES
jgi:signal transduction histidine kinase